VRNRRWQAKGGLETIGEVVSEHHAIEAEVGDAETTSEVLSGAGENRHGEVTHGR
jgi:hypothetical protein